MNAEAMTFSATGTGFRASPTAAPHWPHLDGTGSLVPVPELECDLTSLRLHARPAAEGLVRSVRNGLHLTIGQTAKALGCSRQAVHGWMRGKRIDPENLANLRELSTWAVEWSGLHPGRSPDPDLLDAAFLERLGRHGASTPKGRGLWEGRVLRPASSLPDWSDLPDADEIARRIGAPPVSERERSHRRAHNLGSLKIDARL
jgi:transcriptional regulator with XRE-family HTH domain